MSDWEEIDRRIKQLGSYRDGEQAKNWLLKTFQGMLIKADERDALRQMLSDAHMTITDLEIAQESMTRRWQAEIDERVSEIEADIRSEYTGEWLVRPHP